MTDKISSVFTQNSRAYKPLDGVGVKM